MHGKGKDGMKMLEEQDNTYDDFACPKEKGGKISNAAGEACLYTPRASFPYATSSLIVRVSKVCECIRKSSK
jgi:hypothetical protein